MSILKKMFARYIKSDIITVYSFYKKKKTCLLMNILKICFQQFQI